MSLSEKERIAIQRIRAFEPDDGYYLAYSGGKDSDCIKILATLAGVKFDAVHNLTTVDAPETVRYVKSQPDVRIEYPHTSMWKLIVDNGIPPTRLIRYCCRMLKERGGTGRVTITGVRWSESTKRSESSDVVKIIGKPKGTERLAQELDAEYRISQQGGLVLNDDNDASRRMVEQCYRTRKTMINPIIDWDDSNVWDYLKHYGCTSNPLYQCGYHRIGCIGCPMHGSKGMLKDFARYPVYRDNYIRAFNRMIEEHSHKWEESKRIKWRCGQDVYDWWVGVDKDQLRLEWA